MFFRLKTDSQPGAEAEDSFHSWPWVSQGGWFGLSGPDYCFYV